MLCSTKVFFLSTITSPSLVKVTLLPSSRHPWESLRKNPYFHILPNAPTPFLVDKRNGGSVIDHQALDSSFSSCPNYRDAARLVANRALKILSRLINLATSNLAAHISQRALLGWSLTLTSSFASTIETQNATTARNPTHGAK